MCLTFCLLRKSDVRRPINSSNNVFTLLASNTIRMLVLARLEIVGLERRAHADCHSSQLMNILIEVYLQKPERCERHNGEKSARNVLGTLL